MGAANQYINVLLKPTIDYGEEVSQPGLPKETRRNTDYKHLLLRDYACEKQ